MILRSFFVLLVAAAASSSAFVSRSSSPSAASIKLATPTQLSLPIAKIKKFATTTQLASTATPPASTSLGVTVGDTKGAVLYLNDINISTGSGIQILKNINFRVDAKERWGIVGPNGCGKR
jgi:ATPase subunit of ABC transporter with duplicated ATPase domains